jgi:hypothetical protein
MSVLSFAQGTKFFPKYLEGIALAHTFALPKENWDFTHVSANQDQITVLRSQPGG